MKRITLLIIVALISCNKEIETPEASEPTQKVQENYDKSIVQGYVKDQDGKPLEGSIVYYGEKYVSTDSLGKYELNKVSQGKNKRIWFEKTGYLPSQKVVETHYYLPTRQDVVLYKADEITKIGKEGIQIEKENYSVIIPEGALDSTYKVSIQSYNTSDKNFTDAFPGAFSGIRENGNNVPIESFGFIDVNFGTFKNTQLKDGKKATLKIKAPDNAPDTIPLWYYDYQKASWIEEGIGIKKDGYLIAEVSHFTPTNWDRPIPKDQMAEISGKVVDQKGVELPNVSIKLSSKNYSHGKYEISSSKKNSKGYFYTELIKNEIYDINLSFSFYKSYDTTVNITQIKEELILKLPLNKLEDYPIYIGGDTIEVITKSDNFLIGENLGNYVKGNSKILIDDIEVENIISWENDIIKYQFEKEINEYGEIKFIRNDGKQISATYKNIGEFSLYYFMLSNSKENVKKFLGLEDFYYYFPSNLTYSDRRKIREKDGYPREGRQTLSEPFLVGNTVYFKSEFYDDGLDLDTTLYSYSNNGSFLDSIILVEPAKYSGAAYPGYYEFLDTSWSNYFEDSLIYIQSVNYLDSNSENFIVLEHYDLDNNGNLRYNSQGDPIIKDSLYYSSDTIKILKLGPNGFEYYDTVEEALGERNE